MTTMISTVTRRLANSISCVVLSSSTSGQLTIPLVDPDTGKTVHYALVEVDTPPAVASLGLSPRLHLRTVSESGHPRHLAPETQTARRLDRLAKECMLDISRHALRILEEDTTWPSLASSSRPSHVRSPTELEPAVAPRASSPFPSFDAGRPSSYAETPSLYNDSRSDESMSYVGTPISRPRPRRQDTITALGSGSTANASLLVGLGISGMSKADGSPFDGLGSLERAGFLARPTDSPMPSWSPLPAPVPSPAAFAHDVPEDPVAAFWRTATATDFRRYLDDSVSGSAHAPAGACGSWKVAKRAGAPRAPLPRSSRGHKKHFSMPRAEEDLFMCDRESPALLSRRERIMSHLEVAKLEEESWMKVEATRFLGVGGNRRPVSCVL
ncbi:hypothetical protein FOMPIDRAFT_113552 [Fomitopsis schrenkii]|uniref:Uncharacterized protein n=1 Tax=Fomitopsis schrenkii TaxID=2126942 RepID=S8E3S8_FOMSC|nr:hypothetical protein FOMPIDRAFT_113552 [Fomitopsis schrenkii]